MSARQMAQQYRETTALLCILSRKRSRARYTSYWREPPLVWSSVNVTCRRTRVCPGGAATSEVPRQDEAYVKTRRFRQVNQINRARQSSSCVSSPHEISFSTRSTYGSWSFLTAFRSPLVALSIFRSLCTCRDSRRDNVCRATRIFPHFRLKWVTWATNSLW